jgi:hypothetical protein
LASLAANDPELTSLNLKEQGLGNGACDVILGKPASGFWNLHFASKYAIKWEILPVQSLGGFL